MQRWPGSFPDRLEPVVGNIDGARMVEIGFATHVVAVKAPYHVLIIGDAERVGQLPQIFRRLPAFAGIPVVAQQTQEAREVALDVARLVQRKAQGAAPLQEGAQRRIHLDRAQREHRTIRIEQAQTVLRGRHDGEKLRLAVAPGVERDGARIHGQPSSTQPS